MSKVENCQESILAKIKIKISDLGSENLWEVLDKFYSKFDKILNKIFEIFKQILKTGIFANSFMNQSIKFSRRKLLTINFLRKIVSVSK